MEQKNQPATESQQELQEVYQTGEQVIEGARHDDQLQQLKEAARNKPGNNEGKEAADQSGPSL
jgi:hypothetical protein